MTKIGLLSDTHGFIDERILDFFNEVDEIWHAGDFGTLKVFDRLSEFKPLKGVYGNIDGYDIRLRVPETLTFVCEQVKVTITHIGKEYGKYTRKIYPDLKAERPNLFIAGHSHILQIKYDKIMNFLFVNPGAAGNYGIHKVKTACRFVIDKKKIKDMEILELSRG